MSSTISRLRPRRSRFRCPRRSPQAMTSIVITAAGDGAKAAPCSRRLAEERCAPPRSATSRGCGRSSDGYARLKLRRPSEMRAPASVGARAQPCGRTHGTIIQPAALAASRNASPSRRASRGIAAQMTARRQAILARARHRALHQLRVDCSASSFSRSCTPANDPVARAAHRDQTLAANEAAMTKTSRRRREIDVLASPRSVSVTSI